MQGKCNAVFYLYCIFQLPITYPSAEEDLASRDDPVPSAMTTRLRRQSERERERELRDVRIRKMPENSDLLPVAQTEPSIWTVDDVWAFIHSLPGMWFTMQAWMFLWCFHKKVMLNLSTPLAVKVREQCMRKLNGVWFEVCSSFSFSSLQHDCVFFHTLTGLTSPASSVAPSRRVSAGCLLRPDSQEPAVWSRHFPAPLCCVDVLFP